MAKQYKINLNDQTTRKPIEEAGGVAMVVAVGLTSKVALTDKNGVSVANPSLLVNGKLNFWVADSINGVDIYGIGPNGHWFEMSNVKVSGPNEIFIDQNSRQQTARIPFHIDDATAATEQDTGFDLPAKCVVHHAGMGLDITILDATETIDVGLLSSESGGDANGFMDTMLVSALGLVLAEVGFAVGTNAVFRDLTGGDVEDTYGVLMHAVGSKVALAEGSDVNTDEGFIQLVDHESDEVTAKSISYTLTAGTNLAAGYIQMNYTLMG